MLLRSRRTGAGVYPGSMEDSEVAEAGEALVPCTR
jgi:hypothetical protein